MPYKELQEQELQDEELTLVQMRMPAAHCRHAERMLEFMI